MPASGVGRRAMDDGAELGKAEREGARIAIYRDKAAGLPNTPLSLFFCSGAAFSAPPPPTTRSPWPHDLSPGQPELLLHAHSSHGLPFSPASIPPIRNPQTRSRLPREQRLCRVQSQKPPTLVSGQSRLLRKQTKVAYTLSIAIVIHI